MSREVERQTKLTPPGPRRWRAVACCWRAAWRTLAPGFSPERGLFFDLDATPRLTLALPPRLPEKKR